MPALRHPTITARTSAHNTAIYTAENEEDLCNYTVVKGFCKIMSMKICDTLDIQYFNQLKHSILNYQNVRPHNYLVHLKTVWVIMDKQVIRELTGHYYWGWKPDEEHITGFVVRLNEE